MEYYIQNAEKGYSGNAIYFWALNSRGYTIDLNNAQKFTKHEANKICGGNPEKNKAWEVAYIDNNIGIQRIIDSQFLDSYKIIEFDGLLDGF